MSFGFSVGDFLAVGQLTWTVYRACKGAPGEFQELSRELSTLHTIIRELEDEAQTPTSLLNRRGVGHKAELDGLLANLTDVLKQIEDIVKRYHSLGRDQKRTCNRMKFATQDLANLRSKVAFHMNGINLFMASLSTGSLARIEGLLDELVKEVKAGRKEPSIVSAHDETDKAAWHELEIELLGEGITKQDVQLYKEDIREYLIELVIDNQLSDVEWALRISRMEMLIILTKSTTLTKETTLPRRTILTRRTTVIRRVPFKMSVSDRHHPVDHPTSIQALSTTEKQYKIHCPT